MLESILWFMNEGGPIMWVILGMSICSTGVFLERFLLMWSLRGQLKRADGLLRGLSNPSSPDQLDRTIRSAGEGTLPQRLMRELMSLWNAGAPAMREAGKVFIRGELFSQQRGLGWLELSIRLSPMLGLLGTVIGMVRMFGAIDAAGANSSEVAGGIRVALFTTVAGLSCAIPSLVGLMTLQHMIEWSQEAMNRLADLLVLARIKAGGPLPTDREEAASLG
ncbi:MotA/TolQ/ExbB proton channel family protein [Thermanaerovibrio velox]|uniref:MotA/TolQ/ExbB proton channel family protein n=1 Tax=Thermanaerovibrio velox TaxID=108007 RepID=UPI0002E55DDB|nr:MotA/TolQ/ExbB proton channel family protein [Thermanaerovibrio velox]